MKDALEDRMKNNYENRAKTYLVRRMPVIIRLDGRAFHTFTRGLKKPYDGVFHDAMNETMKYLCENIQGCKLGYTQSDEITLLLTDFDTLTTDAWFDYNVQKLCSVAASMATLAFNKYFRLAVDNWGYEKFGLTWYDGGGDDSEFVNLAQTYSSKFDSATFDARCFNILIEEVCNCFIWRQNDATHNAINMLGQCYFSHKELQGKSRNEVQDMLMVQKGINFNDMPTEFKRGTCCTRKESEKKQIINGMEVSVQHSAWIIDKEIPIFTQDRDYIENIFKDLGL